MHVRRDGPGSGDHGGLIHARALLDLRQVVDGTDHVRQGDLGILVEVTAAGHVALQVNANRRFNEIGLLFIFLAWDEAR